MYVSPSSIANFLRCRQLWRYSNLMKLSPKEYKPAFFLGSGVHHALQSWYQGDTVDPLRTFEAWAAQEIVRLRALGPINLDDLLKLSALATSMLDGYMKEYGLTDHTQPDNQGVRMLAKELEFEVPIPGTDGTLVGRVDGVCVDDLGRTWIFETKTYTQTPTRHDFNFQTLAYTWAFNQSATQPLLAKLGIAPGTRVFGSLWNGLRKQAPSPRVTAPLFGRTWLHRTDEELARFGQRVLPNIYADMSSASVRTYPNFTKECNWCQYADPCQASMVGADEQWSLETNFTRVERAKPNGGNDLVAVE